MKQIISIFLLLFFPIMYKMVKDWRGTVHPNTEEAHNTFHIMLICSVLVAFIMTDWQHYHRYEFTDFIKSLSVSLTGFMLFFPYLFNWHWINRKENQGWLIDHPKLSNKIWYVFNHLSDSAIPDKWPAYRALGWIGRLLLWSLLFSLSVYWFCL